MNGKFRKYACAVMCGAIMISPAAAVSTPGGAKLTTTINDLSYTAYSNKHYALVWLTKADGTFVTTLWKQGPTSFGSSDWSAHCPAWNLARNNSTALPAAPDGYSSATATSYASTNPSPPASGIASNAITITWNGRDSNGTVMPDGDYKFFVEYAEGGGTHGTNTGGLTTSGWLWTKGPGRFTSNPADEGMVALAAGVTKNFTNNSIVWTPDAEIAVEYPTGTNLVDGTASIPFGSFNVGQSSSALTFTVKNSGTAALILTNPVSKDGTNSADFAVSGIATTVAAAGSTTFAVTFTPGAVGARTAAIHIASNDANENPFDIILTGTGTSAYQDWIAGKLPVGQSGSMQTPYNDGVMNLEKFAFNMNAAGPDVRTLTLGGGVSETGGLPCGARVGGKLRIEFLRRKSSTYAGITYTPQFSSNIGTWVDFDGVPFSVTALVDPIWERVVVEDPEVVSGNRFGRVKVAQP